MVKPLHTAICGAGPAGLSAALALNAQGHRITLFDQFETPKPLGSGLILQPTGLSVLDWLGVGPRIRSLGSRIDRLPGKGLWFWPGRAGCALRGVGRLAWPGAAFDPHGKASVMLGVLPINMALLDVSALAFALKEHADLRDALSAYAKARRFHVKLYQAMSRLFTPFYQSDSDLLPLARDYLAANLSRIGPVRKLLAQIVAGRLGLPA